MQITSIIVLYLAYMIRVGVPWYLYDNLDDSDFKRKGQIATLVYMGLMIFIVSFKLYLFYYIKLMADHYLFILTEAGQV